LSHSFQHKRAPHTHAQGESNKNGAIHHKQLQQNRQVLSILIVPGAPAGAHDFIHQQQLRRQARGQL